MFFLLTLLLLINPLPAFASDPTDISPTILPTEIPTPTIDPTEELIKRYRQDHQYSYDLYNKAYLEYTQKKQVHTKYGTLTTQQEKIDSTKKVLVARNNALSTYLMALKVTLDRFKSVDPTQTEKYQIELQKWVDWFNEQNSVVQALNNDEDIKKFADSFNQKYIGIQQILYTSLTFHQINQKNQNIIDLTNLSNSVKNDTTLQSLNSDWNSNFTIKSDLVKSTLENSFKYTTANQNTNRFNDFYPSAKKELIKATQYLTDILSDLKAVVIKSSKI